MERAHDGGAVVKGKPSIETVTPTKQDKNTLGATDECHENVSWGLKKNSKMNLPKTSTGQICLKIEESYDQILMISIKP